MLWAPPFLWMAQAILCSLFVPWFQAWAVAPRFSQPIYKGNIIVSISRWGDWHQRGQYRWAGFSRCHVTGSSQSKLTRTSVGQTEKKAGILLGLFRESGCLRVKSTQKWNLGEGRNSETAGGCGAFGPAEPEATWPNTWLFLIKPVWLGFDYLQPSVQTMLCIDCPHFPDEESWGSPGELGS